MNWLKAIEYIVENPNEKLFNNENKYFLCISNGIPMICKERGVYLSIDLDSKFCKLECRVPVKLTKYNISIYVNDCLIESQEEWISSNDVKEQISGLEGIVNKQYNCNKLSYDLKHKVNVKYEPMFDKNLNIIRKEE